jgi:hypothetical protein
MRFWQQSCRLACGTLGIILLLVGAAQGGPPATARGQTDAAAPKKQQPAGEPKSNDLTLTKPRTRDPLPPVEATAGELIDDIERQNRMLEGFLKAEVRNAVKKARDLLATDAEQAEQSLILLNDKISRTGEARPEVRAQLIEQIEAELRSVRREALVQTERRLRIQQVAAEQEARERINRELGLQEQKVDQLMSRYNALLDAERYRDAEALADVAEEIRPDQAGLRGAELTARMTGYSADMTAVRDLRHKGFVDVAQQIELANVPTSDGRPIIYPDPETWQLLTERRKKYKAVDLTQYGPNETKILAALDEQTELDFLEQPLNDVMDYLKQRHDIEIQLDTRALIDAGIGSDTPITRNIKGITLRSALKLVLGELDLTYALRNEVLLITSKAQADNMLTTRVYPVADLVMPITPVRSMGGMSGMMGNSGGGMGGMGMGGMGGGGMGGGMMGMGGGGFF